MPTTGEYDTMICIELFGGTKLNITLSYDQTLNKDGNFVANAQQTKYTKICLTGAVIILEKIETPKEAISQHKVNSTVFFPSSIIFIKAFYMKTH